MKGKYINTVIMMAALSGRKTRRASGVIETLATVNDHKIIWSKSCQSAEKRPAVYRSATALIH
ncbi:MAG: hypothetical protein JWR72_796 [Flavisolibacter sp.]|jgi:hypothetical protein|nr:hypothetical protein [Flavisolibacter sp.]